MGLIIRNCHIVYLEHLFYEQALTVWCDYIFYVNKMDYNAPF